MIKKYRFGGPDPGSMSNSDIILGAGIKTLNEGDQLEVLNQYFDDGTTNVRLKSSGDTCWIETSSLDMTYAK
jgi:hypothetical protein